MELRMMQEIAAIVPQSISFNYEELRREIGEKLDHYKNMVVTEADISGAKKDKAALNNLAKALNDQRIAQQREYMRPFDRYKAQVDELVQMIKEPVDAIDRQLKGYDAARKEEKRAALTEFFSANVGNLLELLPLEKVWNDRWLNATFKLEEAQQEIGNTLNRVRNDLAIIRKMGVSCEQQMIDKYLQTLDMSAALAEKTRFEELQKKIKAAKRENPYESQVEAATRPAPKMTVTAGQDPDTEEVFAVDLRLWLTPRTKALLKAFLDENNISYGSVK